MTFPLQLSFLVKSFKGLQNLKVAFLLNLVVLGSLFLAFGVAALPSEDDYFPVKILSHLSALTWWAVFGLFIVGSLRSGLRVWNDNTLRSSYRFWGGAVTMFTVFYLVMVAIELFRL